MPRDRWVEVDRVTSCRYCGKQKLAWQLSKTEKWYLCTATYNSIRGVWVADRWEFHDCPERDRGERRQERIPARPDKAPTDGVAARMEELLAAGYRKLAMENHPDHGGDTKAMQEINEAVARLRKKLT